MLAESQGLPGDHVGQSTVGYRMPSLGHSNIERVQGSNTSLGIGASSWRLAYRRTAEVFPILQLRELNSWFGGLRFGGVSARASEQDSSKALCTNEWKEALPTFCPVLNFKLMSSVNGHGGLPRSSLLSISLWRYVASNRFPLRRGCSRYPGERA